MRTVDPNFAGLHGYDQLKVVGERPQAKDTSQQDQGFGRTLVNDVIGLPATVIRAGLHPLDTLADATAARRAEQQKAKEAFGRKEYVEAAGHGLAGMIPFVGPAAAQIGEEYGEGKPGQATAHAMELAAPFAREPLMRGAGAAARGVGAAVSKLPTGGVVQDIAGVAFPQAAHALSLVNRVRKIFGMVPQAEEAAAEYKPAFQVKPGISRQLRFTPGEEPGTGKSYARPRPAPKSRPSESLPSMPESKLPAASKYPTPESAARSAKATKIADLAHSSGVDANLLESANAEQRAMLAKAAGYDSMSDATFREVLDKLRAH